MRTSGSGLVRVGDTAPKPHPSGEDTARKLKALKEKVVLSVGGAALPWLRGDGESVELGVADEEAEGGLVDTGVETGVGVSEDEGAGVSEALGVDERLAPSVGLAVTVCAALGVPLAVSVELGVAVAV